MVEDTLAAFKPQKRLILEIGLLKKYREEVFLYICVYLYLRSVWSSDFMNFM